MHHHPLPPAGAASGTSGSCLCPWPRAASTTVFSVGLVKDSLSSTPIQVPSTSWHRRWIPLEVTVGRGVRGMEGKIDPGMVPWSGSWLTCCYLMSQDGTPEHLGESQHFHSRGSTTLNSKTNIKQQKHHDNLGETT